MPKISNYENSAEMKIFNEITDYMNTTLKNRQVCGKEVSPNLICYDKVHLIDNKYTLYWLPIFDKCEMILKDQ